MELKHHMLLARSQRTGLCIKTNSRLTQQQRLSWQVCPQLNKALFLSPQFCWLVEIHSYSFRHLAPCFSWNQPSLRTAFLQWLVLISSQHTRSQPQKAQAMKTPWVSAAGKSVSLEKSFLPLTAVLKMQGTQAEACDSSWYLQVTKYFYIHCPFQLIFRR